MAYAKTEDVTTKQSKRIPQTLPVISTHQRRTKTVSRACNLIYNLPICIIYTIPEEEKPINSCASKLESVFNPNSNFNNDNNKNTEIYIVLSDFSKEQELKWYSDNNKGIMPEHAHNNNTGFNLRYLEKEAIQLEPNSCTCVDFKIALEILATTIVQLAFRSSLAKKGINIRRGIINVEYIENIIVMLQNDSKKTYIIEPNEKIAQAIFLLLVKIAQLVSVRKREELGITARGIQGFGSTGRIDILVNMAEKKIVDKEEIISTSEATIYESGEIGLTNLYISVNSLKNIKILIYNTTEKVIKISKGIIIGYLTTEVEDQLPNYIPDFPQLCEYMDITSQIIYGQSKCYLLQLEQLEQINIGNLDPL
ncbi:hypothetical protein G9A89_007319 [Geosiphon pyriformis]|nr:hypothetical protein G9A89_007319 [Geosiphon pyriformis]